MNKLESYKDVSQFYSSSKKKKTKNEFAITVSPMLKREDIKQSDCELSDLEEFYLTEIE
jgi:hypothetical protein